MPDPAKENRPTGPSGWIFQDAEVVFVYSRAQAIADGVLVDVSETAREAGYVFPVAVTAGLWADINAIPAEQQGVQDVQGRLWDVLQVGRAAIHRCQDPWNDTLYYTLTMHTQGRKLYTVKMALGAGEDGKPVLTLMRPDED